MKKALAKTKNALRRPQIQNFGATSPVVPEEEIQEEESGDTGENPPPLNPRNRKAKPPVTP